MNGGEKMSKEKRNEQIDKIKETWYESYTENNTEGYEDITFEQYLLLMIDMIDGELKAVAFEEKRKQQKELNRMWEEKKEWKSYRKRKWQDEYR